MCLEPHETYMGSSGYRKIPGNTCQGGKKKDEPRSKPCKDGKSIINNLFSDRFADRDHVAQPSEGKIIHQTVSKSTSSTSLSPAHTSYQFEFPSPIVQYSYFRDSTVILARLSDNSIWQSPNEGYTWNRIRPEETFVAFYHHTFSSDRAYLITNTNKYWYTTDTGKTWLSMDTKNTANTFGLPVLRFHPDKSDYLIWTGNEACTGFQENCHVASFYSLDNGRKWYDVDKYVRNCAWARDAQLLVDPNQIICESYKSKQGNQRSFGLENPLELISGTDFYQQKTKLFDHVVGFAKFSEYLIVAEVGCVF